MAVSLKSFPCLCFEQKHYYFGSTLRPLVFGNSQICVEALAEGLSLYLNLPEERLCKLGINMQNLPNAAIPATAALQAEQLKDHLCSEGPASLRGWDLLLR